MASGTVRGDEFNSIVEGLGPALNIMAKESGINVGKLREMSRTGKLSAEVFANMLLNSNALDESFNKLQPTMDQVDQAFDDSKIRLATAIDQFFGLSDAVKSSKQAFTIFADAMADALTPKVLSPLEQEIKNVKDEIAALNAEAVEAITPDSKTINIAPDFSLDKSIGGALSDRMAEDIANNFKEIEDAAMENAAVIQLESGAIKVLKDRLIELELQLFRQIEAKETLKFLEEQAAIRAKAEAEEKAKLIAIETARLNQIKKIRDAEALSMKNLAQFMKEQKQAQDALISSNESALSTENALRLEYSRNRDTIAELNEILKRNVDLTDEQKTLIPQIVQGLKAQNNEIHHQIKSGTMLKEIYDQTHDALIKNTQERKELLSAVEQLKMQMSSEQFQTEANKALMHGYNEALKENAEARRELLGLPLPDDDMTIEKLTKQVDLNLRNKAINEELLQTFKDLNPELDQLAEAYRVLGITMPVPKKTLESYKDFVDRMDESAKETVNLTQQSKETISRTA